MEQIQILLCQGPVPTQTTLRKLLGRAGDLFSSSQHTQASGSFPACFWPFTVINSLALNVCPSPLFALWAGSLMCIPRSAVTRSGAMALHCHYWYLSPELTSWKHQSAPAAAGNGGGAACPCRPPPLRHWPPFLVWQVPSSVSPRSS